MEENVPASRVRKHAPAAASSGGEDRFTQGETVLGNFKGLGDWDEAVVVGVNADGTYVLDYVDEGLMEEN
eukprot:3922918-Pleurochrysis_carterae.AAC.1